MPEETAVEKVVVCGRGGRARRSHGRGGCGLGAAMVMEVAALVEKQEGGRGAAMDTEVAASEENQDSCK